MADPNHGANSDGSQESQEMTLVIRTGDRTIHIPLKGNMILLENSSDQAQVVVVDKSSEEKDDSLRKKEKEKEQEKEKEKEKEEEKEADPDFLKDIRGSLLTMAALFVGMTFQAVTQPPAWMPFFQNRVSSKFHYGVTKTGLDA